MAQEYRYPLTRVCLRGGNMTLPRTMIDLFPETGDVTVVDALTGEELTAHMSGPRVVSGLGPLYRTHDLDVNDELVVEKLAERRFTMTPILRPSAAPVESAGESGGTEVPPAEAVEAATPTVRDGAQATDGAEATAVNLDPRQAIHEAESALSELEESHDGRPAAHNDQQQASLWEARQDDAFEAAATPPVPQDAAPPVGDTRPAIAPAPEARSSRTPAYVEDEDAAAAVAAVALSSRLRRVFSKLGYRIEPLATGVHHLHADLGRRRYKVLVHLLRSGERLDWAGLLARRRNAPANYMAVVGDRDDLVRLANPADLARATLWSWEALARLEELHDSVPVTPLDLESHFGRDGLFEQGLKRFEEGVAARVAERGAASEVLTRLARHRAPSVFLLEELAQDVNLSRDVVLRILDRFSEAPMHLVAKVDSGEFLLRQPVGAALSALASYADSLRQRLPVGRREVVTGLGDGEFGADLLDATDQDGSDEHESVEPNASLVDGPEAQTAEG